MKKTEFAHMEEEGYKYAVDITLRRKNESISEFIERARIEDLGEWYKPDENKYKKIIQ